MKCPLCDGNMNKTKEEIEQDGIMFEAYKCRSCGEEIMDMEQLKNLSAKYRRLGRAREVKFSKWGNSIAVRIPKELVEDFGIENGGDALMLKEKDGIKITPA